LLNEIFTALGMIQKSLKNDLAFWSFFS